mgnify:CR=1 FL=1
MSYFIDVVLPLSVSLNDTFTYQVSQSEYNFLQIGMRIAVPFGKNKIYTSLLLHKHKIKPLRYEPKEIFQILDNKPIVNHKQIEHWRWIANYYMCSLGEVFKSALPNGYILSGETMLQLSKNNTDETLLNDEEYLIWEALNQSSSLSLEEISKIVGKRYVFLTINSLVEKGIAILHEEVNEKYTPKLVSYIQLNEIYANNNNKLQDLLQELSRAKKQREALLLFYQLTAKEKKPLEKSKLLENENVSLSVVKALIDKNIFIEYFIHQDRISFTKDNTLNINLSNSQQIAYKEILHSYNKHQITLLHGVTASGKTEVYIKLIEEFLKQSKQILYLLPEIALTAQLVERLTAYFGNEVSVFHSKFSENERIEVWNNVLQNSNKAKIVIGVRSALFLPFSNLGFIIVDEEHEQTYKQFDPSPRYNARDSAIILAQIHQAKVLLGSATPSIESYYNAQQNKYALVNLTQRYADAQLPKIEVVNLKDKYFRKKMNGHFSDVLIDNIEHTVANNEQIILFQNRRGFSSFVECITCGHVPHCPHCAVSLTYYKSNNNMRCHYCGYAMAKPTHCHSCNSTNLSAKGFGTEQIEEELKNIFPNLRIARMDLDTTKGKYAYQKIIDKFKNHEIDVLIGTQMLAKGLDFNNVTLVGVLHADNLLNQPDFRAHERAFQLMVQVSGRAGRANKVGKVIIQAYDNENHIINDVITNNYNAFYNKQLLQRETFKYPPFYRLIRITVRHKDFEKTKESALWLGNVLKSQINVPVLGPEQPLVSKIRNQYLRTLLIKIPKTTNLSALKKNIEKMLKSFDAIAQYKSVKVTINVDVY